MIQKGDNKHPKGLFVLFSTEMWERFNIYGMRAILTLFFVNCLNFKDADASKLYGSFLGLSYLSSLLGGYIADNVIGNKKCLFIGGFIMALGQLCLFVSSSIFNLDIYNAQIFMFIGLIFIILGVGLFKPNISAMVGSLYYKDDKRLDSAYTIFYMGINMGAFIGIAICGFLADVKDANGVRDLFAFKWGFLSAAIAILIGLLNYYIFGRKYLINPENNQPIGISPNKINEIEKKLVIDKESNNYRSIIQTVIVTIFFLCTFYFLLKKGKGFDYFAFIYGIIYSLGIALVLKIYLDKSLTPNERSRVSIIIICSFFVIFFWGTFEQSASSLTFIADKQTDTNFLGFNIPPTQIANSNSLFIILISPILSWFWIRLQKSNIYIIPYKKQAIGLLLLAIGYFIIALQVRNLTLNSKIGVGWFFVLYFFQTLGELCLSPIGLSLVFRLAPKRLVSILMSIWFIASAAGYALAGTLGALLPPDNSKFIKAEKLGINLHDVLENRIPLTETILNALKANNIPYEYPQIIGFKIDNIFDFFMCFVIMCSVAAVILFLISNKLQKMEKY